MIGTTLAHYRITAELGAGGMGEVWKAEDTKLGREVALKVLPEEFAKDPDRMARFEREAKVLASLNHPNIATLYGLESVTSGTQTETVFLAMELVEGEDLSERIARGAIPVDEAIPIALQIAEALEAAHEQGIVHRDLKPANIKITEDGTVKVLDFGLAKAWESEGGDLSSSFSPTITRNATVEGVILGTAAYMSPEQARGKKVDRRADIWAFGVVLWEMLTGRKLFDGETVSDVIAAILTTEPDLDELPPDTPGHVRNLLSRCLRRDPKRRMRDMGDVRLELEEPDESEAESTVASAVGTRPSMPTLVAWCAAIAMAVLAAVMASLWMRLGSTTKTSPVALSVVLPADLSFTSQNYRPVLSLAPSGHELVIAANDASVSRLYRRPLSSPTLELLDGSEGANTPFHSPDGRWVGFSSQIDRKLKKLSLDGGQVVTLADGEWGGGSWGEDNTIIYTPFYTDGLWRVSAAGGDAEQLTTPDPAVGELNHSWPDHVPGTDAVIFTSFRLPLSESRIELLRLETGERRVLVENAIYARHVVGGYLVFVREGVLLAAPFEDRSFELTGAPVPILEDALVAPFEGSSQFAVSDDGTLAWIPASVMQPPREVVWVDRSGRRETVLEAEKRYGAPSLSPDGRTLALVVEDGVPDIWLYDFQRRVLNRFTHSPRSEISPIWFPDGRRLAFIIDDPPFNLYQAPVDGSAPPEALLKSSVDSYADGFLDGGRRLVVRQNWPDSHSDLKLLSLDEPSKPTDIRATPFDEKFSTLSPDGDYIAYESDDTGRIEIYVQALEKTGGRYQVSRSGGERPRWAGNGELFFWQGRELVATRIQTEPKLEIGDPAVLFSLEGFTSNVSPEYDVTRDGERIILTRTPDVSRPREVRVVLNWVTELERMAGSGGAR